MEGSQSRSNTSSRDSTVRQEAKEVLQASLFLSVLKHTGDRVSRGDEPARPEDIRASSLRERRRSDPPIVQRVNALIDSIDQCRGPFEKRVTVSDLSSHQNRLILRKEDVREFVLPLLKEDDDPVQGVDVTAFNTEGNAFPMQFKFWCGRVYVLMGKWKAFVRENQLKDKDLLKIWASREIRTDGLCFVISCRRSKASGQSRTENGT